MATVTEDPTFDLLSEQCSRLLGIPGWRLNSWRAVEPDTILVRGAVSPVLSRGPRKGRRNWKARDKSTEKEVGLSSAQIKAFELEWEGVTGTCHKCLGRKRRPTGVRNGETTYEPCTRCDGTGAAAAAVLA